MKNYLKYSITLALFLASVCHAANLTIPNTVELMALNGQKLKLTIEKNEVEVHSGQNEIVYRYVEVLKDGSKQRKYQSAPLVSLIDVPENEDLTLSHKAFSNYTMAAVAFRTDKVDWTITDTTGKQKSLNPEILPGDEGLFPYANIERLIEKYNASHNINIAPAALIQSEVNAAESEKININTNSDAFIKEIKSWYLTASDIERKALLKWMIENN
ncbi:DUF2057 domain-containing protein [Vibrio sp.]|nr:DUF2057 domain-containing protein [Vibrio sp.]